MKKHVFLFGTIAGLIVTAMMVYSTYRLTIDPEAFKGNALIGYLTMIVAFSFIFVAIRNYRNKHNNGVISFGKAFKLGILISLVASTIYVGVWLIDYYLFVPDFMDKYAQCVLSDARKEGASATELQAKTAELANMKEMYKNPVVIILFTYAEIFPVGLVVTLISALILKRKEPTTAVAVN